jgi:hypothetical protein
MSPTTKRAACVGTALSSAFISRYHRGLVDDQEITIKWVAWTASESAGLRIDLKQTVNSARLHAGRFAHPQHALLTRKEEASTLWRPGYARLN